MALETYCTILIFTLGLVAQYIFLDVTIRDQQATIKEVNNNCNLF